MVAKQKNGLYSHAVVTGVTTSTCCNIDFEDGTYSNNMRLEDIEVHITTLVYSNSICNSRNPYVHSVHMCVCVCDSRTTLYAMERQSQAP